MKKFLLACMIACTALGASAQIIRSNASERTIISTPEAPKVKSWNHSGLFVNTGIGVLTGDCDSDFAWELGWGYRWHIASGISWEVFRIGYNTGVSHFKDMFCLRFTTGLRYDTPRFDFLGHRSLFANFCGGWGGRVAADESNGGFAWELGVGVKMTRNCSLSLFYQGDADKYDIYYYGYGYYYDEEVSAKWGMVGLKIEWQFR